MEDENHNDRGPTPQNTRLRIVGSDKISLNRYMLATDKQVISNVWPLVLLVVVAVVWLKFINILPSWIFAVILAALFMFTLNRIVK